MGDVTYRHVFQDMTTESRRASMMLPADITEESPFSRAPPVQEPAQATPGQESEAGSPRCDCVQSPLAWIDRADQRHKGACQSACTLQN